MDFILRRLLVFQFELQFEALYFDLALSLVVQNARVWLSMAYFRTAVVFFGPQVFARPQVRELASGLEDATRRIAIEPYISLNVAIRALACMSAESTGGTQRDARSLAAFATFFNRKSDFAPRRVNAKTAHPILRVA